MSGSGAAGMTAARPAVAQAAAAVVEARARIAPADAPQAREALTRARLLARLAGPTAGCRLLLCLEPHTGRMHQLRVQAAVRGLPIVGDRLYDPAADGPWCGPAAADREPPILRRPAP